MALPSYNPTSTNAWSSLKAHFETIKNTHMSKWFAHDAERANQMTIKWDDFYVDYSNALLYIALPCVITKDN